MISTLIRPRTLKAISSPKAKYHPPVERRNADHGCWRQAEHWLGGSPSAWRHRRGLPSVLVAAQQV